MEVRGDGLEVLHRIGHQAELAIELRELEDHVDEARIELEDLLVDRDRFEEETLLVIEARDLQVRLDRVLLRTLLRVEITDLQPDADVLRILVDDPQVLLHRLVDLSLVDKLAGRIHDLFFVEGHGCSVAPDAVKRGANHDAIGDALRTGHTEICPAHRPKSYGPACLTVKEKHEGFSCVALTCDPRSRYPQAARRPRPGRLTGQLRPPTRVRRADEPRSRCRTRLG